MNYLLKRIYKFIKALEQTPMKNELNKEAEHLIFLIEQELLKE